jgi:hypothetical protein
MRTMALWACGLTLSACATLPVVAQEKRVDPSGTWRWDLEMDSQTIKNELKLETDKDGKLTGTLSANDKNLKVEEGKIDGQEVSFLINVKLDRDIAVRFQGKQDGDSLKGQFVAKSDEGSREFSWDAKRSVEASDAVGAWELRIETPDGVLKPVLTLTRTGDTLKGSYASPDGKTIEAKELVLKDNHVLFQIDSEYQGSKLHVEFKGRPYGAKLKGTLEYSLNGDSGELDFSGTRKADKS